ncbi:MAG TPA: chorismate mutase [Anaerolineae bacterium]|nr:chorismate mutase [Anaerolineae bacterium]
MDELAKWRRRIDEIDAQLVELLNERAASAVEIGKIKRKQKMDIYNPEREKNIIQRICQLNKGPLDDDAIQRIFQQIIEECRNIENI